MYEYKTEDVLCQT